MKTPANPAAHYAATGPEIWADTEGELTAFVAAVGTGGTLTGVGRYLKEKNPAVRVVGVEPAESAVLSGGQAGPHGIEGIGAGFVPRVLDRKVADEVLPVRTEDARAMARLLARTEGVLAGVSSRRRAVRRVRAGGARRVRGEANCGAAARYGRTLSFHPAFFGG